jgi:predicted RNA binding protein YcfA (HicA-like mRNA interferase family)
MLQRAGWTVTRKVGSHVIMHHPTRSGRVVVPVHAGKTVKLGTLSGILDDAGLTADDVARLR